MTTPYRTADPPAQTAPTLRERMACALGLHRWTPYVLAWEHGTFRRCERCDARHVYDGTLLWDEHYVTHEDPPTR